MAIILRDVTPAEKARATRAYNKRMKEEAKAAADQLAVDNFKAMFDVNTKVESVRKLKNILNGRPAHVKNAKIVTYDNGVTTLYSYETPIISIWGQDHAVNHWEYWSATTNKHISRFADMYPAFSNIIRGIDNRLKLPQLPTHEFSRMTP